MTYYITEKELHEYIKKNFPEEDTDCDWKEMKNLKNSFNGHEGDDGISNGVSIEEVEIFEEPNSLVLSHVVVNLYV